MNRLSRQDEWDAIIDDVATMDEALLRMGVVARSSERTTSHVVFHEDEDLRWLLASNRSLRECVAEERTHRHLNLSGGWLA